MIIARVYRIGGSESESAKSEKVLKGIGVSVRNASGDFRDFNDILTDLSAKWGGLTKIQKANIGQTVAGVYHYAKFTALMENFSTAQEATQMALDSSGSAMAENEKYLNSLEGKMAKLTIAFENLFNKILSSDTLKSIVVAITDLVTYFTQFGNAMKVIIPLAIIFVKTFMASRWEGLGIFFSGLKTNILGFKNELMAATTAQARFNIVANSGVGILAKFAKSNLAIIAVTLAVGKLYDKFKEAEEREARLTERLRESNKQYDEMADKFENLTAQYEDLYTKSKTSEEAKKNLIRVEKELKDAISGTTSSINFQSKSLEENMKAINEATITELESYIAKNRDLYEEAIKGFDEKKAFQISLFGKEVVNETMNPVTEFVRNFTTSADSMRLGLTRAMTDKERFESFGKILGEQERYREELGISDEILKSISDEYDKLADKLKENNVLIENINKSRAQTLLRSEAVTESTKILNDEQRELFDILSQDIELQGLTESDKDQFLENVNELAMALEDVNKVELYKIIENVEKVGNLNLDKARQSIISFGKSLDRQSIPAQDLANLLGGLSDEVGILATAYNEMESNKSLSLGTIEKLISEYPEYIGYLEVEGDQIKINKKLLEVEFEAKKRIWIEDAKNQIDRIEELRKSTLLAMGFHNMEMASLADLSQSYADLITAKKQEYRVDVIRELKDEGKLEDVSPLKDLMGKLSPTEKSLVERQKQKNERIIDEKLDTYMAENDPQVALAEQYKENVVRANQRKKEAEKYLEIVKNMSFDSIAKQLGGGSESSKTEYKPPENLEADIDYLEKYRNDLEEINIKIANAKAKLAITTDEDEKKTIQTQLTNLIEQRTSAINDLGWEYGEQARIMKEGLRDRGIAFDENGKIIEASYNKEIKKRTENINSMKAESEQDARDKKVDNLERLKSDVEKYGQLRRDNLAIWEEIFGSQEEGIKLAVEMFMEHSRKLLKELADEITKLENEISMTSDIDRKAELQDQKVKLLTKSMVDLIKEYDDYNSVTDEAIKNSEAYAQGLQELEGQIRSLQTSIKEGVEEELSQRIENVETVQDIVVNMLKKGVELRKEALDKELEDYTDYMDDLIEQKKREFEDIDYEKELNDMLKERQAIQDRINALSMDSSFEGYMKQKELMEEYNELTEQIEEGRIERSRDREIEGLEAIRDTKVKEVEKAKEDLTNEWTDEKFVKVANQIIDTESLEIIKKEFPELSKEIRAEFLNFENTIAVFQTKFGDNIGELVNSVKNELVPMLKKATEDIKNFTALKNELKTGVGVTNAMLENPELAGYMGETVARESIRNAQDRYKELEKKKTEGTFTEGDAQEQKELASFASGQRNLYDMEFKDETGYANETLTGEQKQQTFSQQELDKEKIGQYQDEYSSIATFRDKGLPYDSERLNELATMAQEIRDRWGWEWMNLSGYVAKGSYSSGGVVDYTGMAMLHGSKARPEYVLNSNQFSALFDFVSKASKIPQMATPNNNSNFNSNLTINIYGQADRNTARQIEKAGENVISQIKKTLNRSGIAR